ncbi:ATP-binding protein [Pseudomonas siliginis]|uniref:ATP-binding protein n=1 Tax=Pseudomonas siliginis TaxID=2842346 RepID=UPI002092E78A|nr:ATP-binding protein [Pseudomonas siliginis]UST77173.1 ATP-binding protein [Pseudomonas siliginis]
MNSTTRFSPAAELFLPLADVSANDLAKGEFTDRFFASASPPELACVLLIQNLENLVRQNVSLTRIEVMLEGAIRVGFDQSMDSTSVFAEQVKSRFNQRNFATGLRLLPKIGARLLEQDDVQACDYLSGGRNWDFKFSQRHSAKINPLKHELHLPSGNLLKLTIQQRRLFDEFNAGRDESFHIQGYAGIGKTFLIAQFFEYLDSDTTLLMAYMPSQVNALKARVIAAGVKAELNAHTFGHITNLVLNRDKTSRAWRVSDRQRTLPNYLVTDQQIATWLRLQSVGKLSPREVANVCRRALFSFCLSPSTDILPKHLPAVGCILDDVEISVLVEYSWLIWNEMIRPSAPEIRLPIRNVHRIKYLALTSEVLPEEYKHVIIDESHELTAPMLQILDRSPQAVLTLGDEFQQLAGITPRHAPVVRQRFVTQSLRSGPAMGDILNPLIQRHPSAIKENYEGRSAEPLHLSPYDSMPIPQKPTTIIVENEWGLLGWFKRLTESDARFQMTESATNELRTFVTDLILLFNEGIRPRHRMIFRYSSWDSLGNAMGGNHSFKAAHELLDKGFNHDDFSNLLARYCSDADAIIKLSRIDDVKNQEYDRVLLSRDLLRPPREGSHHTLATACSLLYTASSRAKHELILPGNMIQWVSSISANSN